MTEEAAHPLLRLSGLTKRFPGVVALSDVSLDLHRGEVLAISGENGAGKSNLIKALGGAQLANSGEIAIDGRVVSLTSPGAAMEAGISVIYQESNSIPGLTVAENLFLGREDSRCGVVNRESERRRARDLVARVGVEIDPATVCRKLSVAQRQIVEIAKALTLDAKIIVMDEPTAALTPSEVARLLAIVRELTDRELAVIYVSHRLEEVFSIADRVLVLRDGRQVHTGPVAETTRSDLIEKMVGRPLDAEFPPRDVTIGAERLIVDGLSDGVGVDGIGFTVRAGEVVGLAGLVGAGRTSVLRMLFGADPMVAGRVRLDGREIRIAGPRDAIAAGICLLVEDRNQQGLVLGWPVLENFSLLNLAAFEAGFLVDAEREKEAFDRFSRDLRIRFSDRLQPVAQLSGGNQQKLILAKWLAGNAEVLLFDEPTRGIDVGAKAEICALINDLATRGKAIVVVSSELPELLGLCDRILVMANGVGSPGKSGALERRRRRRLCRWRYETIPRKLRYRTDPRRPLRALQRPHSTERGRLGGLGRARGRRTGGVAI